jgi:hypothetical protein
MFSDFVYENNTACPLPAASKVVRKRAHLQMCARGWVGAGVVAGDGLIGGQVVNIVCSFSNMHSTCIFYVYMHTGGIHNQK